MLRNFSLAALCALSCLGLAYGQDPLAQLPDPAGTPVAVGPAGEVLYVKRVEEGEERAFIYTLWREGEAVEVFRPGVEWDDLFTLYVGNGSLGAEGRMLLPRQSGGRRGPVGAVLVQAGQERVLETELSATGLALGSDAIFVLESSVMSVRDPKELRTGLYRYALDGSGRKEIARFEGEGGYGLQLSPDGKRAAYFAIEARSKAGHRVRFVELASGKSSASEPFRSDDVTFDGAATLFWAGDAGVLYHDVSQGKLESRLMLATPDGKSRLLLERAACWTVLDGRQVVVGERGEAEGERTLRYSILDLRDESRRPLELPAGAYVMGGRGQRLVVMRRGEGGRRLEVLELPAPAKEQAKEAPAKEAR